MIGHLPSTRLQPGDVRDRAASTHEICKKHTRPGDVWVTRGTQHVPNSARERERETDGPTDRQTDGQTDGQTDRETERRNAHARPTDWDR